MGLSNLSPTDLLPESTMVCASPIMLDVYSADPNQAGVLRLGFSLPTPIPMPGLRTDSTAAHTKAIIPPCRSLGRAPRRPGQAHVLGTCCVPERPGLALDGSSGHRRRDHSKPRKSATQDLGTTPSSMEPRIRDAAAGCCFSAGRTKLFTVLRSAVSVAPCYRAQKWTISTMWC